MTFIEDCIDGEVDYPSAHMQLDLRRRLLRIDSAEEGEEREGAIADLIEELLPC